MGQNVMVKKNGKTYGLTKEEFINYMRNLSNTAKARKMALNDMAENGKEGKKNERNK